MSESENEVFAIIYEEIFMKNKITINKKSKLPIYAQIKDQIMDLVKKKKIKSLQLPTERELSQNLNISRNTVSMAYAELEKEGIIRTQIGKGTFVAAPDKNLAMQTQKDILLRSIEHSVEEALGIGFSLDEYLKEVREFIKEKKKMMRYVKLVFAECNVEQTIYFSKNLNLDPHIKIMPVIIADIKNRHPQTMKEIADADLIVTSFYHLDELKDTLPLYQDKLYGISLTPRLTSIVEIAKVSNKESISIVTTSKQFREEVLRSLNEIDLKFKNIFKLVNPSQEQLKEVTDKVDTIIVSPQWRRQVEQIMEKRKKKINLVEFVYSPDKTSINNLKIMLLEQRKKTI